MRTTTNSLPPALDRCPGCAAPVTPGEPACTSCGIWLAGPHAAELRWIDAELGRVDAARAWLVSRRIVLLGELRQLGAAAATAPGTPIVPGMRQAQAEPASATATPATGRAVATPAPPQPAATPAQFALAEPGLGEVSGRTAARLLVAAGAALVVIAATAFTVADWGHVGPLARCAILLAVTALVLAAARPLAGRGLTATAESIAGVGLALTLGDAYLLHQLSPGQPASLLVIAATCAALAAGWACYGIAAHVRAPGLAALVLAQFPIPLASAGVARALGGPSYSVAAPLIMALAATCCADVILARWLSDRVRPDSGPAAGSEQATPFEPAAASRPATPFEPGPRSAGTRALTAPTVLTALTAATAAAAAITAAAALPNGSLHPAAPALAELAVTAAMFGLAAAAARRAAQAAICTCAALAAMAGLAAAITLAADWPARYAGFAIVAVAVLAIGVATRLSRFSPVHARALDLGAGPAVIVAALMAAQQPDSFAVLGAVVALIASATAWIRAGTAQVVALAGACVAALAAVATEHAALAAAIFSPFTELTRSWRAGGAAYVEAAHAPGLPLATVVLAACLAAVTSAVGAWRGSRRSSVDAVVAALPLIAAPASLAVGLSYGLTIGLLLVLAVGLTLWAAFGRRPGPASVLTSSTEPGQPHERGSGGAGRQFRRLSLRAHGAGAGSCLLSALVAALLTLAWALAAPAPTLLVLGCLAATYALCATRSAITSVRIAAAGLTVAATAALAGCAVLAAGGVTWQAGLAILLVTAAAQCVAWRLGADDDTPRQIVLAIEITAWIAAAAGIAACLSDPYTAVVAFAVTGLICLGVAARPDRRRAIWAGLALHELAWCVWLAARGVTIPELYSVPAAMIALAFGWSAARKNPELRSWAAYGLGLIWLLLPSLALVWQGSVWIRPLVLGIVAAAVTLAGARRRLQAPLLIGAIVLLLDAAHALAPVVGTLVHELPGWVPIAVIGALLLWAGATYEARLRNLGRWRRSLAALR